jgi:L-rhamnonate dehydratase
VTCSDGSSGASLRVLSNEQGCIMKIKEVRAVRLTGTMGTRGEFWEDRLVRPLDIYERYRSEPWTNGDQGGQQIDSHNFRISQCFIEVVTNDDIVGRGGPLSLNCARIVLSQLSHLLIGKDALANEALWDQMHRYQVHGRQGDPMIALSAVDCALWDLKGKLLGQPIWRILGGEPVASVPAYASMLGFAVDDPGRVRERAIEYKESGYPSQKWFFRHGPGSGVEGRKANVELVRTLREALGDDYPIMLDCWQSFTFDYAVDLVARIEEFSPRWIEEPFMPDRIETYRKLRDKIRIPIAGAEHEYTRWGFKRFMDLEAIDVVQPDIYWCGGLTETLKVAAIASSYDLLVIPHGHSTPIGTHFTVAQSPSNTPIQEYLVKWNDINMFFLRDRPAPKNGRIPVMSGVGVGMDLSDERIEVRETVSL